LAYGTRDRYAMSAVLDVVAVGAVDDRDRWQRDAPVGEGSALPAGARTSSEAGRKRASHVFVGFTVPTTAFSGMTSSRVDPRGMRALSVSVRGKLARRTSRAAT
jgi:hypothetical protein